MMLAVFVLLVVDDGHDRARPAVVGLRQHDLERLGRDGGGRRVVGDRAAQRVVRRALGEHRAVQARRGERRVERLVRIGGGRGDARDDPLGLRLRDGGRLLALRHDDGRGRGSASASRPSCGQESAEQPVNSSAETATAGTTANARRPARDGARRVGRRR